MLHSFFNRNSLIWPENIRIQYAHLKSMFHFVFCFFFIFFFVQGRNYRSDLVDFLFDDELFQLFVSYKMFVIYMDPLCLLFCPFWIILLYDTTQSTSHSYEWDLNVNRPYFMRFYTSFHLFFSFSRYLSWTESQRESWAKLKVGIR